MKNRNELVKLKIYLYKDKNRSKRSRLPSFVLEGQSNQIDELFAKLLTAVNVSNQQYVSLGTVIFEASRFNFATISY